MAIFLRIFHHDRKISSAFHFYIPEARLTHLSYCCGFLTCSCTKGECPLPPLPGGSELTFYVTDGNIMYLTDASRSLISCVIQHYAPVVGWGGGGTDA